MSRRHRWATGSTGRSSDRPGPNRPQFTQNADSPERRQVAAYGAGGCAYVCSDKAITEGGCEPSASNMGKGSQAVLEKTIQALLGHPAASKS
jgi:hypothetical protein